MKKSIIILIVVVILAGGGYFIFRGYGSKEGVSETPQVPQEEGLVVMDNLSFGPQEIRIVAGETVAWSNDEAVLHNVTSDTGVFASENFGRGETFEFTFSDPGIYDYRCSLHPGMSGTVIVE